MKRFLVFFLILCCIPVILGGCTTQQTTMTGRYLYSEKGSHLIITEDGSPIVMSDHTKGKNAFDVLTTGDKIEVKIGPIRETYPAQGDVFKCKLIQKGSLDDIPVETIEQLKELGWMK